MNDRDTARNELKPLLIGLVDNRLSEEQIERLRYLLHTSSDAQADYVRFMTVHALLQWQHVPMQESPDSFRHSAGESAPSDTLRLGFLSSFLPVGNLSSISWSGSLRLCMILFVIGSAAWFALRWIWPGNPSPVPVAENQHTPGEPVAGSTTEKATIAWLARLSKVEWSDAKTALPEWAKLAQGQEIALDSGRVEILFTSGAQLILEGPARCQVLAPLKAQLRYGKLRARTAGDAKGFVVLTPPGVVTDLGTEFGLNVSRSGETDVVVFDGAVDVEYRRSEEPNQPTQRPRDWKTRQLVTGEAIRVNMQGAATRIVSVDSQRFPESAMPPEVGQRNAPVIKSIGDNLRSPTSTSFYQIVRGGLDEDVRAYVDRTHEWNGAEKSGMPEFLLGADYVRTFNDDKIVEGFEMRLEVDGPADVYVFMDDRTGRPAWLTEQFTDTGLDIGIDEASYRSLHTGKVMNQNWTTAVGAGRSIDRVLSIWKQTIDRPSSITLGSIGTDISAMYGIAAVRLESMNQ